MWEEPGSPGGDHCQPPLARLDPLAPFVCVSMPDTYCTHTVEIPGLRRLWRETTAITRLRTKPGQRKQRKV